MQDDGNGPTLYGATNPFFLKRRHADVSVVTLAPKAPASQVPAAAAVMARERSGSLSFNRTQSLLPTASSTASTLRRSLFSTSGAEPDVQAATSDGTWLAYEGVCAGAHKATLGKLQAAQARAAAGGSAQRRSQEEAPIRGYFYELTAAFLAPFCLYCGVYPPWDPRVHVRWFAQLSCLPSGLQLHDVHTCIMPTVMQVDTDIVQMLLSIGTASPGCCSRKNVTPALSHTCHWLMIAICDVRMQARRQLNSRHRAMASSQRSSEGEELGDFDPGDFLIYLQREGIDTAVLSFAGSQKNALVLYTRFLGSPNFEPWLRRMLERHDVLTT